MLQANLSEVICGSLFHLPQESAAILMVPTIGGALYRMVASWIWRVFSVWI